MLRKFIFCLVIIVPNVLYCQLVSLDSLIKKNDYKFYMFGESHYWEGVDSLHIELFKFFYKHKGVRVDIIERSFIIEYYIQQYLLDGKMKEILLTAYSEYYLKELKEFYDELPDDEKFTVIGVDYCRIENAFILLKEIIGRYNCEDFQEYVNKINKQQEKSCDYYSCIRNKVRVFNKIALKVMSESQILETMDSIVIEKTRQNVIETYQDKRFTKLPYVQHLKNPEATTEEFKKREKYMYKKMMEVDSKMKNKKYFAQFGTFHIPKKECKQWYGLKEWESMISMLNSTEVFRGEIFSGMLLKANCVDISNYYEIVNQQLLEDLIKNDKSGIYFFNKTDSTANNIDCIYIYY